MTAIQLEWATKQLWTHAWEPRLQSGGMDCDKSRGRGTTGVDGAKQGRMTPVEVSKDMEGAIFSDGSRRDGHPVVARVSGRSGGRRDATNKDGLEEGGKGQDGQPK